MSTETFDVLVFGSSIMDFICYAPRLPQIGETLHGYSFCSGFGGKGANQCVAAAKLGAKTAIITKFGDDSFGQDYLQNLKRYDVNISHVQLVQNETTGIAQITVDDNGNNHIIIVTGANKFLCPDDVRIAYQLFKNSKVLICQLETSLESNIFALENFEGISILNAAPAFQNLPPKLFSLASIFCVNEVEAAEISGIRTVQLNKIKEAISKLVTLGAKTIIITLGKHGAVYSMPTERKAIHVLVREIKNVVDTTGAGDAFIGSLAYYIANYPYIEFHQKVGAACEIAAISIQKKGTQNSYPSQNDIKIDFETQQFEWNYI